MHRTGVYSSAPCRAWDDGIQGTGSMVHETVGRDKHTFAMMVRPVMYESW